MDIPWYVYEMFNQISISIFGYVSPTAIVNGASVYLFSNNQGETVILSGVL